MDIADESTNKSFSNLLYACEAKDDTRREIVYSVEIRDDIFLLKKIT